MRWFWGLLIVSIGLLYLGQNLNFWTFNQMGTLWQFWPLILILFGVALLVKHLKFGWVIVLLSFVLASIFVYYASLPNSVIKNKVIRAETKETNFKQELPENISKAKIIINTGAIDLHIDGQTDKLMEGKLVSKFADPEISTSTENGQAIVTLKTTTNKVGVWGQNRLDLKLNGNLPIELVINSGASSLNIDLSENIISGLTISAGASSINIKINQIQNYANLKISAGASSIDLSLPKELGVKVQTKTGLSSKNFNNYKKIDQNNYQSENYETASNKINLEISAGASSIQIKN